jgi:hypothetical protein
LYNFLRLLNRKIGLIFGGTGIYYETKNIEKGRRANMKPDIKTRKDEAIRVMGICGLDNSYSVQKTIMETGLYSVYLLSSNDQPHAMDQVLLIEHPPAQEPSAHLLSLQTRKRLTTSELMEEIVESLEIHFARKD